MKVEEEATPPYFVPVNGMRPIHPGQVLREEFLMPDQLTAHALSMARQVPAPRINDIVREKRAITVDTALRLGKFLAIAPNSGWACKPTLTRPWLTSRCRMRWTGFGNINLRKPDEKIPKRALLSITHSIMASC